jgi:phosphinothricin acetyltransferase
MMDGQLLVRPAAPEDLEACRRIYALEVVEGTASFELEPPDAAEFERRFTAVRAAGLPWLVAATAAGVVGYAYAGSYRPRPAYRWTVESTVYVARDARGRGIARRLLAALVAAAARAGARQMVAVIGDSANHGSRRLHAACGFREAGILRDVGFKHGRWLDTVMMQRGLGPGATNPPAMP